MRGLLILIAVLINYGSLYPFEFASHEGSLGELLRLFSQPELRMGRGDLIGNLLLFLPYGLVAALLARQHTRPTARLSWLLVLGGGLALALQLIQVWLPSRVPSLGDVVTNLAGLALGVVAARSAAALLPPRFLPLLSPGSLLPAGLMLLWLAYLWYPLVPTLDMQNIINAVKPLLREPRLDLLRSVNTLLAWLMFFQLASLAWPSLATPRRLALLGLALLAGKPFIVGASLSPANVAGLLLALLLAPWFRHPARLQYLLLALLASLMLAGLQPFTLADYPGEFHWLPFSGFLTGSMSLNLLSLLEKTYLYAGFILLASHNGARPLPAAVALALCLALIEGVQVFLSQHTAEITDPLLALLLGFGVQQFMNLHARPRSGQRPRAKLR